MSRAKKEETGRATRMQPPKDRKSGGNVPAAMMAVKLRIRENLKAKVSQISRCARNDGGGGRSLPARSGQS